PQLRNVLWLGALCERGGDEACAVLVRSLTMQLRCVSIRTEQAAEELAHQGHRTALLLDELRKRGGLVDATANPDARQRHDGTGQLQRQHDAPFARVIAAAPRSFAGEQLDIVESRLSIERLRSRAVEKLNVSSPACNSYPASSAPGSSSGASNPITTRSRPIAS